ncbi:hypothetical protein HZA39_03980 [Candidatus Peregrinibacteria bacterium]|nr:hypothetical protein [Candidatus Peregrinibacteria bacterium]
MCKKIILNILLTTIILSLAGCDTGAAYDNFARCITSKNAKMYGTHWCTACAGQKREFGSSFQHINYVECDPNGENSKADLCLKKGIKSYPTWEFSDGSRREGVLPLEELAKITNCELKPDAPQASGPLTLK